MPPLDSLIVIAVSSLLGLALLAGVWTWSWRNWLLLKRHELDAARPAAGPTVGSRIELADLRERIRKLEAIAEGVDI